MASPNAVIASILSPAYGPCPEFKCACTEMRWQPEAGHVPRGFLGAAGDLTEVELVLVFAEPGDPHDVETHTGMESAYAYAAHCFGTGKDLFHKNVRQILEECWRDLSFERQLRKVWLIDSVLCSARNEGGSVSRAAWVACGRRYLLPQLAQFPNALVVALGKKAQTRLHALGCQDFLPVFAAAPPGCNQRKARESWERIPTELQRRRKLRA